MRKSAAAALLAALVAACGGGAEEDAQAEAPSGIDQLRAIVEAPGGAPEGMVPREGESGEIGLAFAPPGSDLRDFMERHNFIEAYGITYEGSSDPKQITTVIAARFATPEDVEAAIEEVNAEGEALFGAITGILAAAAGYTHVPNCVTITMIDRVDDVMVVWVDTSRCVPPDDPSFFETLTCPNAIGVGESATVTVRAPQYVEPWVWEADAATIQWKTEGPVTAAGGEEAGGAAVTGTITAAERVGDVGEEMAQVTAEFEIISILDAFGGVEVRGGLVEATCTLNVVGTPPVDASGTWEFLVDVTETSGSCVGEEEDPVQEMTLEITQTGSSLVVSGVTGAEEDWTGTVAGNSVTFDGTSQVDLGTTSSTFKMTLEGDTMTGEEVWSWKSNDGDKTCPTGASMVTARRAG